MINKNKFIKPFFFIFLFIIFSVVTYYMISFYHAKQVQEKVDRTTKQNVNAYNTAYKEKKILSKLIFEGLLRKGRIAESLVGIEKLTDKEQDKRRKQVYSRLKERFYEIQKMDIRNVHIHLANNSSFLRLHEPGKFGDDLFAVRESVVYVNKYKKAIDTFEAGKFHLGLRFVYPIFYNKQHVGSMEVSFGANGITGSIMDQYYVLSNMFIKEEVINEKGNTKEYKKSHHKGYYFDIGVLKRLKKVSRKDLKELVPEKDFYKKLPVIAQTNIADSEYSKKGGFIITVIPLSNKISNNSIGFLSIRSKADDLENEIGLVYILSIGFLAMTFYLFYTLVNKKDELVSRVNEKTVELNELNKNLEKRIEKSTQELKKSLKKLEFAIEGSNDGLWEWNIQTDKVYFSTRWKEMLGYSGDELDNSFSVWQERIHPDDLAKVMVLIEHSLNGDRDKFEVEHRLRHKNGNWIWIYDRAKTSYDTDGNAVLMSGFHTDITAQKSQELFLEQKIKLALAENTKQLEALQQQSKLASMGEMIGAIAHQWRQPLNELSINIQNLEFDYSDGKLTQGYINKFVDDSKHTIEFMSKTIDDFRSFFRIDKEKRDFDIRESIESVITMQLSQFKIHAISIEVIGKNFHFYGLQSEFQQVVLNLINNAKDILVENLVKNPHITIEISDNKVYVKDNAGGVSENIFHRVFEPYFTTKEQGKGTGMGLYISKMIIEENLGGKLSLSNGEEGATFLIDFSSIS